MCVDVCGGKQAPWGENLWRAKGARLGRFMGPRQNMMGLRGQDRTEGED